MRIIVGSKNPAKIAAVKQAFAKTFPETEFQIEGYSVNSGVSDQPMDDHETLLGAGNRAESCRKEVPDADFWIGLEGGCQFDGEDLEAFAWMVIKSDSIEGKARTSTFILPPAVAELVKGGMELGHADDLVFKRNNSKQKNGAVGILTKDLIDRSSYYEQALILALIPFINKEIYKEN
jgi:inosine/xanthosine triphosphatase